MGASDMPRWPGTCHGPWAMEHAMGHGSWDMGQGMGHGTGDTSDGPSDMGLSKWQSWRPPSPLNGWQLWRPHPGHGIWAATHATIME